MRKCLEFAMTMTAIVVINSLFAMWVGSVVADRVNETLIRLLKLLSQL